MVTALDVTLASGIMMNLGGSIRPAMYLASELAQRAYAKAFKKSLRQIN